MMPELEEVDPRTERQVILDTAMGLVLHDRHVDYDAPIVDFTRTAAMWSAYTGHEFSPHDVAVLMVLVKVSRLATSPQKLDSWVDIAGYAACGGEVRPGE